MQIVDAAGTDATPAAFYLGLCRLRGILSPPAPRVFAAGGPFFYDATEIRIGRGSVAAMTFRKRALLLADTMHCSDSRFQAQTWQSVQLRGSFRALPCSDS